MTNGTVYCRFDLSVFDMYHVNLLTRIYYDREHDVIDYYMKLGFDFEKEPFKASIRLSTILG
jgi:hypothetical protein